MGSFLFFIPFLSWPIKDKEMSGADKTTVYSLDDYAKALGINILL